jgi:hypothetical protein
MITAMPTVDELNHLFELKGGELFWKNPTNARIKKGQKVGSMNNQNCLNTRVNNKSYLVHRLIYKMAYHNEPLYVDHIDGNRLNNHPDNLRDATPAQNLHNMPSKKSSSGCKNVHWNIKTKKWRVAINCNNKVHSFGYYHDIELADLVAHEARDLLHGAFANHKVAALQAPQGTP